MFSKRPDGESRQRRIQGGKPFAKGFSPLKIPLFGRPKGACGPLWKPQGCGGTQPQAAHAVAAAEGFDDRRTRHYNCAPAHVGTPLLREMGGLPRGTQWGVPLGCALSFATSFCTSRKKWRPRREQVRSCGAPRSSRPTVKGRQKWCPPQGNNTGKEPDTDKAAGASPRPTGGRGALRRNGAFPRARRANLHLFPLIFSQ